MLCYPPPTLFSDRFTVRGAVFLAGATLMALEVAAFRIVGRTFGTALRETTTVIAVFMTSMSLGYWGGGKIGDRFPTRRTMAAFLFLAALSTLTVPWMDRVVSPWISSSSRALGWHALAATTILFFIPTLFLSAITPIGVRLFAPGSEESGRIAGSMSALSTIGSIAGTILSAFVLLDWLQSINRTVLLLAAVLFLTALLVLLPEMAETSFVKRIAPERRRFLSTILVVAILGGAANAVLKIRAAPFDTERFQGGARILWDRDSSYNRIIVKDYAPASRILQFGMMSAQTRMDLRDPSGPGLEYTNYMLFPKLMKPRARRILLIGLGGGTTAKQYLRFFQDVTIDGVEIDPMVVDVAGRFFQMKPSDRFRIHVGDGRLFIRRTAQTYDIVIIDTYTVNRYGATIPSHIVTREFFTEVASRLSDDGILYVHCFSAPDRPLPRALLKTLRSVFPAVDVFGDESTAELFAQKSVSPIDDAALERDAASIAIPHLAERAKRRLRQLPPTHDAVLLTDDYSPVDQLLYGQRAAQ